MGFSSHALLTASIHAIYGDAKLELLFLNPRDATLHDPQNCNSRRQARTRRGVCRRHRESSAPAESQQLAQPFSRFVNNR